MLVYSKKIIEFISEIKIAVKKILSHEVGLKVKNSRFFNFDSSSSYPICIVIYNNKEMLGYFDSGFYELGFHEKLMYASKEQLLNIIRHELAHYIVFIKHGHVQSHGLEFKRFCESLGWKEEVYRATICLEGEKDATFVEESGVLRKVQKLMALATSSNQNEAEQAMIKSQQLLLKHNIESRYIGSDDEEKMFLKRILKQKKESAKMRAIAKILETFFVSTVYRKAQGAIYLEILGSAVSVEIAEYVADVLLNELEKNWNFVKKEANLKGMVAKNSFFLGVARGYCDKIQALKRSYSSEVMNALLVIENKLIESKDLVYDKLASSTSRAGYCSESSILGEKMGRQLNINPGVGKSQNSLGAFIAYKGS